jgi:hypothetical protein
MYRLKIINLSKESLQTALHKSQNRRFCLNAESYYMDGNYGHLEGFKCEYYKKASGKEQKVHYRTLLYSVLDQAHVAHRDLYAEIRNLTVPSAPNFSHDDLLAAYFTSLNNATASNLQLKEQLAAQSAVLKEQRAKSKLILQAREEEKNALTDPDAIRERDEEAAAHASLMRSIVGGVRLPGDTSSSDNIDSSSSSEEDDLSVEGEEETAPQHLNMRESKVSMKKTLGRRLVKNNINSNNHKQLHISRASDNNSKSKPTARTSNINNNNNFVNSSKNKKFKRYVPPKDRNLDSNYSSTDSELDEPLSDATTTKSTSSMKKKKSRGGGSAFLESNASPVASRENSPANQGPNSHRVHASHMGTAVITTQNNTAFTPRSMLDQIQGSICEEIKNKKKRSLSHHIVDNSIVAEYDPHFPDLDGHPHNDSLLHEIEERLVRVDSDEDAEMDDEDPHTVNVGWGRQRSDSPSSVATHNNKKSSRAVDPAKAQKQQAVREAAAAKKEEKRQEAKARRNEAIFQRRVLEVNNGRNSTASETDEDQNGPTRKRRVTSGISSSWTGFYGVNLALNQAQLTNSDIIIGCADHVLGTAEPSRDNTMSVQSDSDYSVVLSYRKQSGAVCDKVLKQKLMKHLQLDIFKEITFERLITEYSVAKRESVGVGDDEIIDIDWFEVMDGFSVNLKNR